MATRSWNRVELIGNLTRDPELRYTPQGTAVCTFSIATNRTYISDGEKKEEADFHRIVAWNKLGELCNTLLKKGSRVFISGRLQNRSWEAQDGQNKQITEIVIEDMILLTSKNSMMGESSSGGTTEFNEDVTQSKPIKKAEPETESPTEPVVETPKESPKEEKPAAEEQPKTEDPGNLDDLPF